MAPLMLCSSITPFIQILQGSGNSVTGPKSPSKEQSSPGHASAAKSAENMPSQISKNVIQPHPANLPARDKPASVPTGSTATTATDVKTARTKEVKSTASSVTVNQAGSQGLSQTTDVSAASNASCEPMVASSSASIPTTTASTAATAVNATKPVLSSAEQK